MCVCRLSALQGERMDMSFSSLSLSLSLFPSLPLFHPSLLHTLYLPLSVPHLLSSPSSCHAITFIFCSPPLSLPLSPLSLSLSPLSLLPSLPHALSPLSFPPSLALCGSHLFSVPFYSSPLFHSLLFSALSQDKALIQAWEKAVLLSHDTDPCRKPITDVE